MPIVYALIDPITHLVRYIGQSTTGLLRPKGHLQPSLLATASQKKRAWLTFLQRAGLVYGIVVLQECRAEDLSTNEKWWIAYGRASGWPLTNTTCGGSGLRKAYKYKQRWDDFTLTVAVRLSRSLSAVQKLFGVGVGTELPIHKDIQRLRLDTQHFEKPIGQIGRPRKKPSVM